jgi:hypothetical protein
MGVQTTVRLSWRKRHPVISRSVLYVLGLGLAALLAFLYAGRKAEDESAAVDALGQELDALSLVHVVDPTGEQVLALLDEKFSGPTLPVRVRGRALRWRALAHRRRQDRERVEAALREAATLDLEPRERAALRIEWAEARLEAGQGEAALEVLPDEVPPPGGPLELLRVHVRAHAHVLLGRPSEALALVRRTLAELSSPLASEPRDYVGGRPWSLAEAAHVLTEFEVRLADGAAGAAPWMRLRALAPSDYDAQVAAARGLAAVARSADARSTWARARALDPRRAASDARSDPVLAGLERDVSQ